MSTSSFARLGKPLQKEAFVQKAIDGAWNGARDNFVNPVINAGKQTVSGIGSAASGVGNQALDTVKALPKAIAGGFNGLSDGASKGGLGGAVQGAIDGVWNSGAATGESMRANGAQVAGGLSQAADGVTSLGSLGALGPTAALAAHAYKGGIGGGSAAQPPAAANPTPPAAPSAAIPPRVGPPAPLPQVGPPAPPPAVGPPAPPSIATTTGISSAPPKAIPVPGNPMNDAIARFRSAHGTAYDPHSPMDRRKLQQMMPKSAAWAALEKRAGLPGGALVEKGLAAGAGLFGKARAAVNGLRKAPAGLAEEFKPGLRRMGPAADAALTIGGIGGAGVIGHHFGSESGRSQGVAEGVDAGIQRGVQAATAAQPGDPGVLGRLMDVFRGAQQGPDAPAVLRNLQGDKDNLIKSILAGRPS